MIIVNPSKIRLWNVEINSLNVSRWRVDMSFTKVCADKCPVSDDISFTDEEGNLDKTDIAELYWILFTEPEYQKITGVYYDDKLIALWMMNRDNNTGYITWDGLGVLVVNCLEGMKYSKENMRNENFDSGKET
mgnify:FL=1